MYDKIEKIKKHRITRKLKRRLHRNPILRILLFVAGILVSSYLFYKIIAPMLFG